jgi:hypothetical protein
LIRGRASGTVRVNGDAIKAVRRTGVASFIDIGVESSATANVTELIGCIIVGEEDRAVLYRHDELREVALHVRYGGVRNAEGFLESCICTKEEVKTSKVKIWLVCCVIIDIGPNRSIGVARQRNYVPIYQIGGRHSGILDSEHGELKGKDLVGCVKLQCDSSALSVEVLEDL